MDAIGALVRLAFRQGDRFLEAAPDAVGDSAHGFFLLNASTSSAATWGVSTSRREGHSNGSVNATEK